MGVLRWKTAVTTPILARTSGSGSPSPDARERGWGEGRSARVLVARAYSTSTSWVIPSMTCGIPFTGSGTKQNAT